MGFAGSDKKIGYWGTFFLSLILSPLIGLIVALVSAPKTTGTKPSVGGHNKGWKHYYEAAQRYEFKEKYVEALDAYQDSLFYLRKISRKLSKKEQAIKEKKEAELKALIDNLKAKVEQKEDSGSET